MGCHPGVCIWSLQYSSGVRVGIYGLTYSPMTSEGTVGGDGGCRVGVWSGVVQLQSRDILHDAVWPY